MSNPEPSIPAQEQVPFTSSSSAHASTTDPAPAKKSTSKRKMATKADPVKPIDASATRRSQYRYEPYRKAVPTPEPEENCPADLKGLQTLDATAKKLYKSDLEMLEYIETLKGRTAAILKQVNRNDTQLRSGQSAMERIEQYVRDWQRMDDRWSHQQLFGDDNFRAKWEDGKRIILGPDESADEEEGSRDPGLFPTMVRGKHGAYPTVQEHLFKNLDHPDFPHKYAQDVLGESAPRPPAAPNNGDENGLDGVETRPNLPVLLDHAVLPSDGLTLKGASTRPERDAMGITAALAMKPPPDPPHPGHPSARSYVPSSPDLAHQPQHLVAAQLITSPSKSGLSLKRKRASSPGDGEVDNDDRPSTNAPDQAKDDEDGAPAKRRRVVAPQPTWDPQMFLETGCVPTPPRADPTRENSPEPSSQPAHRQASPPSIPTSQVQKEDSEIEKSQVFELLSQAVEQGGSEDEEESTENILAGLEESQHPLPALTTDDAQANSTENTESEVETPAKFQMPMEVAEVSQKDADGDVVIPDCEHETPSNVSYKSARFSVDGKAEKEEYKVFRKTPGPKVSPRTTEANSSLSAEVEVESQDELKPLPSLRKKRAIGPQARKRKATPSTTSEPAVRPEDGLPSISTSEPPSKLRRGRSTSVQPDVPALGKSPVRKSTRGRK